MRADERPSLTRRRWLGGGLSVVLLGARPVAAQATPESPADAALRRAREAGLRALGTSRSEHYVAVGDAPESFRKQALDLCERLASSFLDHFRGKGFEVGLPESPMTVVALAGRDSFRAFKGGPVSEVEGGYFEVAADRLVIFDFRAAPGEIAAGPDARRINTFTLVHEAMHQLTFSAGLLRKGADIPLALSEGLATYGEVWQLARPTLGGVNRHRLAVLASPRGGDWIPVERLLATDDHFHDPEAEQTAYAEAWLLTSQLLKTRAGCAKLRTYLERLRGRTGPERRAADAADCLGDLPRLDRELKRAANLLIRG